MTAIDYLSKIHNIISNRSYAFFYRLLHSIFLPALIFIGYIITWFILSFPYRLFPCDDGFLLESPLSTFLHVSILSIRICKFIWSLFSKDITSSLIVHAILSNAMVLFILAKMVFRITRNNIAVIMAMLLYATSAWHANYYFMASYTVFAAALHILSFLFIIEACLDYKKKKRFLQMLKNILRTHPRFLILMDSRWNMQTGGSIFVHQIPKMSLD